MSENSFKTNFQLAENKIHYERKGKSSLQVKITVNKDMYCLYCHIKCQQKQLQSLTISHKDNGTDCGEANERPDIRVFRGQFFGRMSL